MTMALAAGRVVIVGVALNFAETLLATFIVSVQEAEVPEHPPLHPENVEVPVDAAISVTGVPWS